MQTIQCIKCLETKELDAFPIHKNGKHNRSRKCFICTKKYKAEYFKKNQDYLQDRAKKKLRGEALPSRQKKTWSENDWRRNYVLQKKFDITTDEYLAILEKQGGGCGICGRRKEESEKWFAVDHNHETGRVRGILCGQCNMAIGLLKDNTDILNKAIQYIICDGVKGE